jgi:hypothetical protein
MSEDEETQKKGMVVVYIANNSEAQLDNTYAWKAAVASRSQPMRVEAMHFCMDNAKSGWRTLFDTIKMAMHPFLKVRVKTHVGTFHECMESLQTYGIPSKDFPIRMIASPDGTSPGELVVDNEYHVEMMMKRRERENRYKNLINMSFQNHTPRHSASRTVSSDDSGSSQWLQQQLQQHQHQQLQHQQQLSQPYPSQFALQTNQDHADVIVPASVSFVPMVPCSIDTSNSTMFESSESTMEPLPAPISSAALLNPPNASAPSPAGSVSGGRKKMKKKKSSSRHGAHSSVAGVCIPSRNDVLFGRGKRYQNHVGNQRFRMLIDDCLLTYDKAGKEQKTKIAQEIVGIVHQARGRFLKDDGAGWAQVTDIHLLRQKVAHAFRGLRSQKQMQASQAAKAAARKEEEAVSSENGSDDGGIGSLDVKPQAIMSGNDEFSMPLEE